MGTTGAGLFQDDVALDVRNQYLDLLANGVNDQKALTTLVTECKDLIKDADDGPVFWLALAATQWEYGLLLPRVKSSALKIIDQRKGDGRWIGSELPKKREAVLAKLKEKLLSPLPSKRTPKLRVLPQPKSLSVPSPDKTAIANAWSLGKCHDSGLPRSQVYMKMKVKRSEGGCSVFVAHCAHTDIKLKWLDADTLQISYPKDTQVEERSAKSFYRGRTIAIKYRRLGSSTEPAKPAAHK